MAKEKKRRVPLLVKLLIGLAVIIAIPVIGVGIAITDFTDNTPSYCAEMKGVSTSDYLGQKAKDAAKDCGVLDDYEYLLNEEEINRMLATITPNINIPLVNLTSIYLDINEEDQIHAEAPFQALIYKSCAKVDGYLSYDKEVLSLRIQEIKANLLTSKSGLVASILSNDVVENMEKAINDSGVHLSMEKQENDIVVTMTNINICQTIVDCCKDPAIGFLSAALAAGALNSQNVELVVNENGYTGVIVKKSLL